MGRRDLIDRLDRIEYLLEYLSREIETIKRILGLGNDSNIFSLIEGGIETYRTITSEYKRILNIENMIRSIMLDGISKDIMRILAYMGPMNITQITKEIKRRRGRASRLTVSRRLKALVAKGIVKEELKGREKVYYLL
ncbi:MAG: helix-turn-helix domain-containing protein [Candidatus Methanomethylicia archaeon]